MPNFVVFNDVPWKPPIRSTMLTAPTIKIKVDFPDDDLREMTPKQRQAFDAEFKKFDAEFFKLGNAKIKTVQDAVTWTDERIAAKATVAERKEVVATANKMLEQAFAVFQAEIQKLAQKWFDQAVEKSYQVMKMKLVKARAKAIAKITVVVMLTLTAAALTIAASVVTGGAATPLVIGAVLVGIKAAYATYKTIDDGWMNAKKQMDIVGKDVATLKTAATKLEEQRNLATTGHKPAMDMVAKLRAAISGKLVDLDKHVGQLDKFVFAASQGLKKQNDELNKISEQITKSGDPALKQKADKLLYNIMKSLGALRAMDDVRAEALVVKKAWDSQEKLEVTRLDGVLRKIGEAAPFLLEVKTGASSVFDAAKKLSSSLK